MSNTSQKTMTPKKLRAKRYYFGSKLTQRDIAAKVNVTEKTLGAWIRVNGWDLERQQKIEKEFGAPVVDSRIIDPDFLIWLKEDSAATADLLMEKMTKYIIQTYKE